MFKEVFDKHPDNPIITTHDLPYQANAVFNAGAADLGDEILLLLRVESCSGRSHLIVARSKDGIHDWRIDKRALLHPSQGHLYEINGVEDSRITRMEDEDNWVIAYVGYTGQGPGVALATTKDFREVERLGLVMPPDDKNAALFPRKFDGKYAMLHRPSVGGGSIWVSFSSDMKYWGESKLVLPARGGPWWDGRRVGAGPQPIKTKDGWLIIYHGVKEVAGFSIYRLGAALLDIDNPTRLIARARRWFISPYERYERSGDAPNVVFGCGAIVRGDDLLLYYGAADCSICVAKAKVSEVLQVVEQERL